jgi:RNA polymerase primary sigma factor
MADTAARDSGGGDPRPSHHQVAGFNHRKGNGPAGELRMASKAKAAVKEKKEEAAPEKDAPDTPDAPLPLLDLSDAAVRKMIKAAKKRGYVTHDQVNAVLPS